MSPEERWERIATVLLWTAVVFVAIAAYGIYDGDDARGIVMTLGPAAVLFALWYLAARRRDQLINGDTSRSVIGWIASGVLCIAGIAYIVVRVVGAAKAPAASVESTQVLDLGSADLEVGDIPDPNGSGTIRSLARKHHE